MAAVPPHTPPPAAAPRSDAPPADVAAGDARARRRRTGRRAGQGRRTRRAARSAAQARLWRWAGRALPLAFFTALSAGAASLGVLLWSAGTGADPFHLGGAGVHFEGDPLPAGHPLLRPAAPPLAYRQRCVWGKPGSNPYRGTVVQALQAARLPDEVVRQLATQVAEKRRTDRLEIRRDGIRALGSGRVFDPRRVALTFGETMCLGARVNFAAGHMEPADLYEASDHAGRVYAVMVPEVCGNVSVLSQQGERRRPLLLAAADPVPGPMRRLPAALEDGGGDGIFAFADDLPRHDVPEPGTLACVALGLAALVAFRRRR
ncbi:PEP-CTERM sorting domain-containing protein [Ideonella sp. DXS22W]|uniref:PEP-CTERM sorting domain-containing protein n=1 Tax=Pseudaquabacterium inlustre TaxID=2984192 RepID=A0ABU9CLS7_9BURK